MLSFDTNKHGHFNHDRNRPQRYVEFLIQDSRHVAAQYQEMILDSDDKLNEKDVSAATDKSPQSVDRGVPNPAPEVAGESPLPAGEGRPVLISSIQSEKDD